MHVNMHIDISIYPHPNFNEAITFTLNPKYIFAHTCAIHDSLNPLFKSFLYPTTAAWLGNGKKKPIFILNLPLTFLLFLNHLLMNSII